MTPDDARLAPESAVGEKYGEQNLATMGRCKAQAGCRGAIRCFVRHVAGIKQLP
jgi:hypothetical protein